MTGRLELHVAADGARHLLVDEATSARIAATVKAGTSPDPFLMLGAVGPFLGIPIFVDECPCSAEADQ
jgi:hypothetical protein